MKLWVDDIRQAPSGFVWCKTVRYTITLIQNVFSNGDSIELIDLDHDAGDYEPYGGDYIKILDWLESCGLDLSSTSFRLHTQNPVGRENMRRRKTIGKRLDDGNFRNTKE